MVFVEKIKEAWPLVTKARFNRLKEDRDALFEQHKKMSDRILGLAYKASAIAETLSSYARIMKRLTLD